ncbi:MAG: thioester reductase domain-containing protein, partial [Exilibacterium sp.]
HIYGLIRASAENHGGRANSLTAPNPKAQAELLRAAYRKAGVEPDSIGYIEAHGTGTELGDPIEINGLKSAFADLYREAGLESGGGAPHCGLGSVKSNIGHLELASGVAGVIKVLLQFRHRTLVKSLHCERLNPYIDLQESPFYVVQENREWRRLKDARGREWPRRAGVSSFGFGGVNAHVVLEEFSPALYGESLTGLYRESSTTGFDKESSTGFDKASSTGFDKAPSTASAPRIIVLSARSEERLKAAAANLAAWLTGHREEMAGELESIAYTLQVGRTAMKERLAVVADNMDVLIERLDTVAAGGMLPAGSAIFRGNKEEYADPTYSLLAGEAGEALLRVLLENGDWERLALYWVKGGKIPWESLYSGRSVHRVSLPGYPFARDSYWYSQPEDRPLVAPGGEPAELAAARTGTDVQAPAQQAPLTYIRALLSQLTNVPPEDIEPDRPFLDYGIDSISAMKLIRAVRNDFQIGLSGEILLDHNTARALAEYLISHGESTGTASEPATQDAGKDTVEMKTTAGAEAAGSKSVDGSQTELAPYTSAYNVPFAFVIKQPIDVEHLRKACEWLLDVHPILRTTIGDHGGMPYQRIDAAQRLHFEHRTTHTQSAGAVIAELQRRASAPFCLETGPLMRVHLISRYVAVDTDVVNTATSNKRDADTDIKNRAEEHYLLITIHHIIFDGASLMPLLETLVSGYRDLARGDTPSPRSGAANVSKAGYRDFVRWERQLLSGGEGERLRDYWRRQLQGELAPLNLPFDRPRPALQRYRGKTRRLMLDAAALAPLTNLARSQRLTLSVVFLGIFKTLLHRYTGQEDIVIGMPTIGRPEEDFENLIGYFVNMVAIRSRPQSDKVSITYLKELQRLVAGALDCAAYPFPRLVKDLKIERDQSMSPVFQVSFAFQNFAPASGLAVPGAENPETLRAELLDEIHAEGEFDLSLEVIQKDRGALLNLKYNPDLFDAETIDRMMGHYVTLAAAIGAGPPSTLSDYPLLTDPERRCLLSDWNRTAADYPRHRCLHEFVERGAERHPQAIALTVSDDAGADESLTYGELNSRANQLAHYLIARGVKPGALVGLCVELSLDMVIGLLSILKAGAAYVPMDPGYPPARLAHMLDDAKVALLITQEALKDRLMKEPSEYEILCIDTTTALAAFGTENPDKQALGLSGDSPAYVIYTSGSSGKPKGVLCRHGSVVNLLTDFERRCPLDRNDVGSLWTSFGFDVSCYEIFSPLMAGATLTLIPAGLRNDPHRLFDWLAARRVTSAYLAPAHLPPLLAWLERDHPFNSAEGLDVKRAEGLNVKRAEGSIVKRAEGSTVKRAEGSKLALKRLLIGVEPIPAKLIDSIIERLPGLRVINGYGPSETTICATLYDCDKAALDRCRGNIPIGAPVQNTQVYILDANLKPVPVGVKGELYIGGEGLALGYVNQAALTAERFIENPFAGETGAGRQAPSATKLYKTGDQVRWLACGQIEFIGRIDQQVKIRGNRIELGEIESALLNCGWISDAVVVARDEPRRLVAWLVPDPHRELTGAELIERVRQHLTARLPAAMIPSAFMALERIPLTPNGKVDRRMLESRPLEIASNREYRPPRDDLEASLADIWSRLLEVERVGIHDDFFELGGHSLLLVKMLSAARETLRIEISMEWFFASPTIYAISESLQRPVPGFESMESHQPMESPRSPPLPRIDWESEAGLDASIDWNGPVGIRVENPRAVFLTGATGFVGAFLLRELLESTRAVVYCLVRAPGSGAALRRIKENLRYYGLWSAADAKDPAFRGRILALPGDLEKDHFGLDRQTWEALAAEVDIIYHNGARVHHLMPYAQLRRANVKGTETALHLAASGKLKSFQFMSTLGVFSETGGARHIDESTPLDAESISPAQGYIASKWVAEKLVMRARERHIPSNIHRLGRVVGDSRTGAANADDLFYRFNRTCIQLGRYIDDFPLTTDITPVDVVARAIVKLSTGPAWPLRCRDFHLAHPEQQAFSLPVHYYNKHIRALDSVSAAQWLESMESAIARGIEVSMAPYLPIVKEMFVAARRNGSHKPIINNVGTLSDLHQLGIDFPDIDDRIMGRYFDFMKQKKIL